MVAKFIEKRKSPRLSKSLPLKVIDSGKGFITETQNISTSGAYCRVNKYIAPLTKLDITLFVPGTNKKKKDHKVSCRGVVVRTEASNNEDSHYNVAIFFNHIKQADIKIISNYVNWHLGGQKN